MGGKNDFIHIRSDEELKRALKESAIQSDRKEADQARFLLRLALGLSNEEKIVRAAKKRIAQMQAASEGLKRGNERK